MRLKISGDKVSYNPKYDEYEINVPVRAIGTLFGVPIYVDEKTPETSERVIMAWIARK